MSTVESLRIGTIPFANVMPLDFFLPEIMPEAELICEVPSKSAKMLAKAQVDVALVSIIELFNHPEYSYIPGIGICSDGPVESVCLFSQKEPQDIQSIALDNNSLASNTLLRILLREYWQISPKLVTYTPPVCRGLEKADAALCIGDNAFYARFPKDESRYRYDLGALWKELTGLPFVYAAWITRPELNPNLIADPFVEAKEKGLKHVNQLSLVCAQQRNLPADFIYRYFTQNIYYDLGEKERQGIHCYFDKAKEILNSAIA
ncbi:MAG: menaquinone biosynthesis protein [bacterium]|nr:menaquinone biosynthesis protein [bacterium]